MEDENEKLRAHDLRTQRARNREQVIEFFTKLEHYVTQHPTKIGLRDQKVLKLYIDGLSYAEIGQQAQCSLPIVKNTIAFYRKILR